jgi:ABC-type dipeptide/oligopeptide/nickel transport system ATPase component
MPPKNKPKSKKQAAPEEMINFYELDGVRVFCPEYHNPSYNKKTMPLKHPMRAVIVGASGSGKSNVLLNLIKKMDSTFNSIKIFTQDKNEPLYLYLESVIEKPFLEIYEGIDAFNNFDMSKMDVGQHLIIFDDFVVEPLKKQQKICEMYIRSRKMCESGISVMYLTQSFYQTPIIIRRQATVLMLKKINGQRELKAILKDCALDTTGNQLESMYDYCVASADDIQNLLLIDKTAPESERFRKNLKTVLNPNDF